MTTSLGSTPAVLVAPEGPTEHARNIEQIVACVTAYGVNERGNYEWSPDQMAGLVFRLQRIVHG